MQQLNERQQKILGFLSEKGSASSSQITAFLDNDISRFTVLRDLDGLLKDKRIKKTGKGRSVKYEFFLPNRLLSYINPDEYFKKGPDERRVLPFDAEIFDYLLELFSSEEIDDLNRINSIYIEKLGRMSDAGLKKEIERLTIELSWKSSRMEGNTYSLIDTEMLIKERIEAKGHKKEETIMILNHKNAIDYIFNNKNDFKELSLFQIEKVHELLTRGLNIDSAIRGESVGITGTRYRPINDKIKIIGFLNKTIDAVNSSKNPFAKALIVILMISYLQPFSDGNKRTARILANAVLLANNACPLSYRNIDEADYKKATLLFYEQNNARFLKELFMDQFKFAVDNYF
jgi:prophage maintenance system killer protein